jgi:cytochrome P450
MDAASAIKSLGTPAGRADPYPAYAAMHAHGPVIRYGRRVHIVVGYRLVDAMMRDSRLLLDGTVSLDRYVRNWRDHASMVMMANSLHSVNPPDHTRVRRVFGAAFTARRVARLEPAIAGRVAALLGVLAEAGSGGSVVDFLETFAYPLPLQVFCDLVGVPVADGQWLRPRWEELVAVQQLTFGDTLEGADRATEELSDYFTELLADRRAHPRDDVTSALVEANRAAPEPLTGAELVANLVLLLMAGWETVANLLGSGVVLLAGHPDQARRLRADDRLAGAFVEEILRLESPIQWTLRWVAEDVTVAGVEVRANQHVQMMLGAANRDPARFPDPDRFDPDRPDNHPLVFGAGAHICLGAVLGKLQGTVALPRLLRALPGLAVAGPPTPLDRPAQRGYAKLPVTVGAGPAAGR